MAYHSIWGVIGEVDSRIAPLVVCIKGLETDG